MVSNACVTEILLKINLSNVISITSSPASFFIFPASVPLALLCSVHSPLWLLQLSPSQSAFILSKISSVFSRRAKRSLSSPVVISLHILFQFNKGLATFLV